MMIVLIILGIISVLYGVLILQVGSGTFFWLIWEVIGAGFLIWAILLHNGFWEVHKKLGTAFHSIIVLGAVLLTILCVLIATQFSSKGVQDLDYIIVLGAQVREDGPSTVLKYRLETALDYLNENPETVCIVSGGQGVNEPCTEAEAMAEYLVEHGIDKKRIILEDMSKNTMENIRNSKTFIDATSDTIGIVTNNFHMFRAVKLAEAQGLEDVYGIAAESNIVYLPNNVLRECLGIVKDWLVNHI